MERLTATRTSDFWALHGEGCGSAWCWCVAWWVDTWDGWGERTSEQNRALREQLFERGEYDGYLLYDGSTPVAWCQAGLSTRSSKLTRQFSLPHDTNAWALGCVLVAPARRRQGLARHLLEAVLTDLRERGIRQVFAFPREEDVHDAGDLWTGPCALYRELGFSRLRARVYERQL